MTRGLRGDFLTIESVEEFVDEHCSRQIDALAAEPGLRSLQSKLDEFRREHELVADELPEAVLARAAELEDDHRALAEPRTHRTPELRSQGKGVFDPPAGGGG